MRSPWVIDTSVLGIRFVDFFTLPPNSPVGVARSSEFLRKGCRLLLELSACGLAAADCSFTTRACIGAGPI